jgi:haloalkane dehalogenase
VEIEIGGLRVCWREQGRGSPVVLVHGSPRSSSTFDRTLARLSASHRVLAPDLPGFGRSDKPLHGLAFPALANLVGGWLERVLDRPFALVAQGWGAPVALAAAPPERVRALVLANTTLRRDVRPPLLRRAFRAPLLGEVLVDLLGRGLVRGEDRRALASGGTRRSVLALERLEGWSEVATRSAACAAVPRPTLLLWGEPDPLLPRGEAERLRSALPAAELVRLPGAGHFPQEGAAEAFAEAVLSFFGRHGVS